MAHDWRLAKAWLMRALSENKSDEAERWNKVESIFHQALEADESRRGSVIEESCAGDMDYRFNAGMVLLKDRTKSRLIS